MKITILCNRDLASCIALNQLLPALSDHELTLFVSDRVGGNGEKPAPLQQLAFFEQTLFNDILFPAIDRITTSASASLLTFEKLGTLTSNSVQELNQINKSPDLQRYQQSQADLVISIRYGCILRQEAISLPKFGVINLHSGLLPDYKGVMASFRALLDGVEELGTTLHYIDDATIDTGRVISTSRLPVQYDKSYLWHVLALYTDGCQLIVDAVAELERSGSVVASLQRGEGNYYSFPNEEELALFAEKGFKLVDPVEVTTLAKKFIPES